MREKLIRLRYGSGRSDCKQEGFTISCVIFLCAVVLLVTHSQTGLTVSCIGVFIAAVTLITSGKMLWTF